MRASTTAPIIDVTIGRHARRYQAFITTAPPACDAPATLTLHTSTWADVSGFAADPDMLSTLRVASAGRVVLVDTTELDWQQAKYRDGRHVFAPADPVLLGPNALQHWLWSRLTASTTGQARKTA